MTLRHEFEKLRASVRALTAPPSTPTIDVSPEDRCGIRYAACKRLLAQVLPAMDESGEQGWPTTEEGVSLALHRHIDRHRAAAPLTPEAESHVRQILEQFSIADPGDAIARMSAAELETECFAAMQRFAGRYADAETLTPEEERRVDTILAFLQRHGILPSEDAPIGIVSEPTEAPVIPPLVLQPGESLSLDDLDQPALVEAPPTIRYVGWQRPQSGYGTWQRVPGAEAETSLECSRLLGIHCDMYMSLRVTREGETPR